MRCAEIHSNRAALLLGGLEPKEATLLVGAEGSGFKSTMCHTHPEQTRSTASCHSYNPRNRRTMRKDDSVCPTPSGRSTLRRVERLGYGSRRLRWPARSSWEPLLPQRLRLQTRADLVNQRT
jgi:hypothetical protein